MLLLLLLAMLSAPSERLATLVVLTDDPAVPRSLARLSYDCRVTGDPGALPGLVRDAPSPVLLVTTLPCPPTLPVDGWVAFAPALPDTSVPSLTLDAPPSELAVTDSPTQKALRKFVATHAPLPPRGLPGATFVASPNWSVRNLETRIDTVVLHSTVVDTMQETQDIFLDEGGRRVSAHYVVDRDGTIVQMVDERLMAHHAGVSELDGRTGVNDFSIGIELVNRNDGLDPYPEAQYRAVAAIVKDLRTRHAIPDDRIVSHARIARPVGRKSDPLGFDFARLRVMLGP